VKVFIRDILAGLFILSMLVLVSSCRTGDTGESSGNPTPATSPPGSPSVSNGERIYNTATSDSGQPVTYTGGPGMMMSGVLTCAICHGPEGHGGTVFLMMQTFSVPNITWPELSGPDPDMEHPPYTEDTLKRAITEGLEPDGGRLEYPMPVWHMSAQDLNDLVAFIKTLK
jgi:cytochrome c oxidase subunit 2